MAISDKIEALKEMKNKCFNRARQHSVKHRKLKRIDDIIGVVSSTLNATSITLIVIGFTIPPCLVASAVCSGIDFVLCQIMNKYDIKARYLQHQNTNREYSDLVREISIVLLKNNMPSDEYDRYLEEVCDKISMIENYEI